ncbi:MAG: cupin domain-containing protein [Desulfuromonas sp.]|nr:MAG: cupin domain-containing protein [Desulfuromonas sp.]
MFQKHSSEGYCSPAENVTRKTLVYGEKTLMVEIHLVPGGQLPRHRHPHEQTGYLVSGQIELTIGDQTIKVSSGDSWCVPGGDEQGLKTIEKSVAIEVFSPVREDYIR